MTETAVVYTNAEDEEAAARDLSAQIGKELSGPPDALIVFAAPRYDHPRLLGAVQQACAPKALVGASSAGEFTRETRGEGMACALALRSDQMRFTVGIGRGIQQDRVGVAKGIASTFHGLSSNEFAYRAALVLTDALAGHADDLVDQLTLATAGKYQFFGGGAGDNAEFQRTHVFFGTEAVTDAAVALEILSHKPLGIGVGHGWEPASAPMRVTEAQGPRLISLNGFPAAQAFSRHAESTGQRLDVAAPIPFFLQNILGIQVGEKHRLRVPLAIESDGTVLCAADLPVGATVAIMRTTANSAIDAAARATASALENLQGAKPKVALFFDCVATRLRLGDVFGYELQAVADKLGTEVQFAGCNTHGQIARATGQFGGFHNCTAVVCALPE
ncbi:MAG: FIST C-terminal domain-containing protein [Myxococcota bacterium]|nr:FIST C-terminal domain-containing protein [Myxococcota bacterium]